MLSVRTFDQKIKYPGRFDAQLQSEYGEYARLTATVRYDDSCRNGHNSFAITGEIFNGKRCEACGCLHEDIARLFPELAPLIKWHHTSSDGPMHYIANTLFWLGYSGFCDDEPHSPPNIAHARKTAIWPDMPESFIAPFRLIGFSSRKQLTLNESHAAIVREALTERLPRLMPEFKAAVESLGLVF